MCRTISNSRSLCAFQQFVLSRLNELEGLRVDKTLIGIILIYKQRYLINVCQMFLVYFYYSYPAKTIEFYNCCKEICFFSFYRLLYLKKKKTQRKQLKKPKLNELQWSKKPSDILKINQIEPNQKIIYLRGEKIWPST